MITVSTQTHFNTQLPEITRREAWRLVTTAANLVRQRAVILCNQPALRIRKRRKRDTTRGKKGSQYTVFVGSRPGFPPRVRRGHGRKSIAMELYPEVLAARVGVRQNAFYMGLLEIGTGRIAPRPWLIRALEETEPALRALRIS